VARLGLVLRFNVEAFGVTARVFLDLHLSRLILLGTLDDRTQPWLNPATSDPMLLSSQSALAVSSSVTFIIGDPPGDRP
jgi:hypothetical protein